MLITVTQITRLLKAADDTLALAENYIDKSDFKGASCYALVSSANSHLASTLLLARQNQVATESEPNADNQLPVC